VSTQDTPAAPEWYAFNINDQVRVKLTPTGRAAVLKAGYAYHLERAEEKINAEGYTVWTMWQLMYCVGPCMTMGFEPPFENCKIMFCAKEAKPC